MLILPLMLSYGIINAHAFWDMGTTTLQTKFYNDPVPRTSFFRWQKVETTDLRLVFWNWDWEDIRRRRTLCKTAGISIDKICLSTATILNRRTLITAANFLEPYRLRMRDVRVWALGRAGRYNTPYRYRVWRWRRLLPRSLNPEHKHGPRGSHVPRHDVCIIHTRDQMYLHPSYPNKLMYAYRGRLTRKYETFLRDKTILIHGSGFEHREHVMQNYKIMYGKLYTDNIRNCEHYNPKYWGKFVCVINSAPYFGIQNGGGMYTRGYLIGLGCFEITVNEDRIFCFTDLRYYYEWIYIFANFTPGAYYEYAYPEWGVRDDREFDYSFNDPYVPTRQIKYGIWPLG